MTNKRFLNIQRLLETRVLKAFRCRKVLAAELVTSSSVNERPKMITFHWQKTVFTIFNAKKIRCQTHI